ncbi:MAG: hypothetical protein IT196_25090 [Acidimicrobiales bacterium]|nr:hypothetical protein [Acidimicrobiales bacterium]
MQPNSHVRRARTKLGAVLLTALAIATSAGCGDDGSASSASTASTASTVGDAVADRAAATSAGAADALDAFCAVAAALNGAQAPTSAQIAEYASLAPAEIASPAAAFVDAFEAADGNLGAVFADPDAVAAAERLTQFEAQRCGITPPGPPAGAGS